MLRIGIIGCGKIAQIRHAPEYAQNPACRLAATFDGLPERAEALARQHGAKAYRSIEALLASGVDAVSVCVSNEAHAAVTVQALEAGCHVLCEKPMATTLAQCENMVDTAARCGKLLMLGHNQRFSRAHIEARRRIAAGEIGRVLAFHTRFGHPGPEGWTADPNSWFFDKRRAVFGAIMDLGIHKADVIHYLLDEPVCEVSAMLETLHKTFPDGSPITVDDNALCLLRTRSGVPGTLHASWTFYGAEDNSTRIYGTEGTLRCYDDPAYSLIIDHKDGTVERLAPDRMATNKEQTEGNYESTGVIDAFIEAIVQKKASPIDGWEALKAMRVVFAAEQSAQQDGARVWIEPPREVPPSGKAAPAQERRGIQELGG